MPTIYSHHQKFVVVDKRIGFVGGLDLTVGRYERRGQERSGQGQERRGEGARRAKMLTFVKGWTCPTML